MTGPAGPVWAVVEADDGWSITADGRVVETVRSHYDAWSVLEVAERLAGRSLLWRLGDGGGFESA